MDTLRGRLFRSLPLNSGNTLPCQIKKASQRHHLSGNTHVPSQLTPIESRRRSHASAESRNRIDADRLPAGPQEGQKWATATVVENKAVSLDGRMKTLVLSVEDKVVILEGRSMAPKQAEPRWADAYTVPGQFVAIRCGEGEQAAPPSPSRLYALASSPYAVHRDSADLDASIIEVLVDRDGSEQDREMALLGPGKLLQVSNVVGRGFSSLFNSYVGLMSAMEESRDLLLIGAGCQGIAPLRAVLEWTPVQASATAQNVTLVYLCSSPSEAAWVKDWDEWRAAGITVTPVYVSSADDNEAMQDGLLTAILGHENGLHGTIGGDPREATILMSGLPGPVTATLSRKLTEMGVERERILFCDYF